jgi:hypothetical protein
MPSPLFEPPALCGPLRRPRQMLADQRYDGHKSIHDDAMAESLGLRAGPIEGPTHFSQFDPLLAHLYGPAWFETGCLSAHYQNMVVDGEEVRAFVQPAQPGRRLARIWAEKRDEVIALSESPRTESAWIRTRVFDAETHALVAEIILNHAVMKASYAAYDREAAELARAR